MRKTLLISAAGLAAGVALAILLMPSRRLAVDKRLPAPGHIPQIARAVLEKRMERHGDDMTALLGAVVLLDHDASRTRAESIAADASLSRPLSGDASELNAQLPEAFFQIQNELRAHARVLAAAASRRDGKATADAFGALTRTCVSCHMAYLAR